MTDDRPTVLVVEDKRSLADMYAGWLEGSYRTRTAYGGEMALERLDASVDVILLDRLMPDLPGEDVLDAVSERGLDCRIALVTALEPDYDIIDLGFDDYLVKPVFKPDLYHSVEALLTRESLPGRIREYHALAEKRTALELAKSEEELRASDVYAEFDERVDALRKELPEAAPRRTPAEDICTVFRRLAQQMVDDVNERR